VSQCSSPRSGGLLAHAQRYQRRAGDEECEHVKGHHGRRAGQRVQARPGERPDQAQPFPDGAQGAVGLGEPLFGDDLFEQPSQPCRVEQERQAVGARDQVDDPHIGAGAYGEQRQQRGG
jgi:hypothetical protein